MTQSTWNTIGYGLARRGVRLVLVFLYFTLIAVVSPAAVGAADEQTGPFLLSSSTQTANDVQIEAKIRRALRQDAQLQSLNLGVRMRGGVASLSGPLPTGELRQRAITIVQRIEGVLSVSAKDLYISPSENGGKRLSVVIPNDRPTQTRSASPGLPSNGLVLSDRPVTAGTGRQVNLLAPETAVVATRVPEAARLTANPHPPSQSDAVAAAVEQLRQRESRYQQIRVRVQDTTVYILTSDASREDAMLFAQAVRRIAGVQHVIIAFGETSRKR